MTFGIRRTGPRPNTDISGRARPWAVASRVDQFVEKPDLATATQYVAEGYLWNSGNFLFRARPLLEEYRARRAAERRRRRGGDRRPARDLGFVRLDADAFAPRHRQVDRSRGDGEHPRAAVVPVS